MVCLLSIVIAIVGADGQSSAKHQSGALFGQANDMVCGPRCLRFIMRHYGKQRELIDLVKATQWPDIENGASLARMETVLRESGVGTQAVRVPTGATIKWPHPVLMHYHASGSRSEHYIVLIRTSAGISEVYWGIDGFGSIATSELWRLSTGIALLTSPSLDVDPQQVFSAVGTTTSAKTGRLAAALFSIAAIMQLLRLQFTRRFRRKETCLKHEP